MRGSLPHGKCGGQTPNKSMRTSVFFFCDLLFLKIVVSSPEYTDLVVFLSKVSSRRENVGFLGVHIRSFFVVNTILKFFCNTSNGNLENLDQNPKIFRNSPDISRTIPKNFKTIPKKNTLVQRSPNAFYDFSKYKK